MKMFFFKINIVIILFLINSYSYSQNIKSKTNNNYLYESFEENYFPPKGWTKVNPLGGNGWDLQVANTIFWCWSSPSSIDSAAPPLVNGGTHYSIASWYSGNETPVTYPGVPTEQWLITPNITIMAGYHLKFYLWYYGFGGINLNDSLDILLSTTTNEIQNFTNILADYDSLDLFPAKTWKCFDIDLSSYAGQSVFIAFKEHISNNYNNGSLFALDLVTIGIQPDTDIAVTSIDLPPLIQPGIITPKAKVLNIGSTTQTFNVTMTINPSNYSSTKTVNNLSDGVTKQVIFDPCVVSNDSIYKIIVTASLIGDNNLTDNSDTINRVCWQSDSILYNSTDIYGYSSLSTAISSIKFEKFPEDYDLLNCAADFIVPSDTTWTITSIYINGVSTSDTGNIKIDKFGIIIYSNNNNIPNNILFQDTVGFAKEGTNNDTSQTLVLNHPIILNSGIYWLSVFAIYDTLQNYSYKNLWKWKAGFLQNGYKCVEENKTHINGGPFEWNYNHFLSELYFTINGTYSITGITNNLKETVEIYPNPVKNTLYIKNAKNFDVIIYDLTGKTKLVTKCNSNFFIIDLSYFSDGVYIVKTISDKNVFNKKINILK